jgi:integrase
MKYCSENPRLRFYHALAYETSAGPGELLELKIGDIKIEQDSNTGKMYSALDIGRQRKKRQSRIVGITDFSIQYLQAYLLQIRKPLDMTVVTHILWVQYVPT